MADLEKMVRLALKTAGRRPLEQSELKRRASVSKKEAFSYKRLIADMIAKGELVQQNRRLVLSANIGAKSAVIVRLKETFGFARLEEEGRDVFIPGSRLMGAFPGDRVLVKVAKSEGELENGEVLSVLEQKPIRLSGTVRQDEWGDIEFVPDNSAFCPMPILGGKKAVKPGKKVVAAIKRGESHRDCRAVIEEEFGSADFAKNCCEAILNAFNIEKEFPEAILKEAETVSSAPIEEQLEGRLDLRNEPIFTIDGADTKDIDDAVSVEEIGGGWRLGVHIADVSSYVLPHSKIDEDAFLRGTSIYFADSVIPMLPPALSNGACSLNPNEDRLAFSAIIELDGEGAIKDYRFCKTVIRSRVKGVYSEVNRILVGDIDDALKEKYREVIGEIPKLARLAEILRKRRFGRGALNLFSVESKITVDENGAAADVKARQSGEAESVIEELMLTANEAAALFAQKNNLPFVYRVHENPAPDKLAALKRLLDISGLPSEAVQVGVRPGQLADILKAAEQTPYFALINSNMLRAMQKARYSDKNLGHYGLALADYAHFTSPIRRYPDLAIHRIMSDFLAKGSAQKTAARYTTFAVSASKQSSAAELNAMSVERACEDCYKAEYMSRHIGESFEGTVVSVAPHGVYVQLENTVEGLVRAEELDGMIYEEGLQFTSTDGKSSIRIGDKVRVAAVSAEVATGRVDFILE